MAAKRKGFSVDETVAEVGSLTVLGMDWDDNGARVYTEVTLG